MMWLASMCSSSFTDSLDSEVLARPVWFTTNAGDVTPGVRRRSDTGVSGIDTGNAVYKVGSFRYGEAPRVAGLLVVGICLRYR